MQPYGNRKPDARPLIIPLFIPHQGCPHRCIFCNQGAITGAAPQTLTPAQVQQEVARFLKYGKQRPSTIQISFFGGNFLGLKRPALRSLLEAAMTFVQAGQVDSIRFSTRPDTVCENTLRLLEDHSVSTVELGVQSMNDRILAISGRGHRAADTVAAARQIKRHGYRLGLQMMVGLPADDDAGAMDTARRMAALQPDFVRIYPTLVLAQSELADWFKNGRYQPMSLSRCIRLVKQLYLFFTSCGISVARMGLQASDGLCREGNLLAGPHHPAFGHLVHAEMVFDRIASLLNKLKTPPQTLCITTHPSMVSRVQGLNKKNIDRLKRAFGLRAIILRQDVQLAKDHLLVANQPIILP
ncbi:MAG: radical SAM protein [Desulfosarcina sp.]|jgi:histone acetyltransferase (RNA polymerase elongator complex component)